MKFAFTAFLAMLWLLPCAPAVHAAQQPERADVLNRPAKTARSRHSAPAVAQNQKRKPTLLPAAQRRNRSSTPPVLSREEPARSPQVRGVIDVARPWPRARNIRGERGILLGIPYPDDPRVIRATPSTGSPPLPPARNIPGERGIPLGLGPLSPQR